MGNETVVTTLIQCMCVCVLCMHLTGFVWAITCTFVNGFQNNLAQLLSSRSRIDI